MKRENPKLFYKMFKKRKRHDNASLTADDFKSFFEQLMKSNTEILGLDSDVDSDEYMFEELDHDIQIDEVLNEIKNLKTDKATGLDGIMNEIFISCKHILSPVLTKLFNKIMNSGHYPTSWSKGIVIPIHKKGSKTDVNNYRPITLLNHVAKLFTSLVNSRLMLWSEHNNIVTDAQLGFRPGCGTVDAIFLLHALITSYISKNKRLYCCFVDYTKAFDSIQHYHLWRRLSKVGVNGKLFTVIKSMYDDVKSCSRLNNEYSDFYKSFKGLIQGDALSPLIFSLFINDIELELMNSDCSSLQIQDINLFLLMYADDTVLLAETPENLQMLLDSLHIYTEKWGLKVNTVNSKIVVFRSSWHMYETEHWTYNNENIEVLNTFRYLGLCLNYNGKFNITHKKCWLRKRKKLCFA